MKNNHLKINISTKLLTYFLFVTIIPLFFLSITSTLLLHSSLNEKLIQDLSIKSDFVWLKYDESIAKLKAETKEHPRKFSSLQELNLKNLAQKHNYDFILLYNQAQKPFTGYISPKAYKSLSPINYSTYNPEKILTNIDILKSQISTETLSIKDIQPIIKNKNYADKGFLAQITTIPITISKKQYYLISGKILNKNSKFFTEIKKIIGTYVFIVQNNKVLLSNISIPDNVIINEFNETKMNSAFYKTGTFRSVNYIYSTYPLKNFNGNEVGTIVIAIQNDYLNSIKAKNSALIFKITLLAALAGIALSYILSKSITKPISQVADLAYSIEKGDFSKRVKIKTNDELGYLAKSFNKMTEALEKRKEIENIKEDLVATITHDLKVPLLANVQTLDYVLKGTYGDLSDKQKFITEQLILNNKELLEMVNVILETHKYEAGKQTIIKRNINLTTLISDCISEIKSLADKKAHEIIYTPHSETIEVFIDRQEIKRVIINLIGNAITYTPNNGKILVFTKKQSNNIVVTIEDNGVGIPEKSLNNLFKRFSHDSPKKIGTGLGLYLSKHIIESHNGKIWVESLENQGSSFHFTIPLNETSGDNNE